MEIKRGDIYIATLEDGIGSEQNGTRPVLVIQKDIGNLYSPTTIVAALTSKNTKKPLPTHIVLPKERSGFSEDSLVMLEQIHTIDKTRLKRFVRHVDESFLSTVNEAIKCSIGLVTETKKPLSYRSNLHKKFFENQVKNNPCICTNQYLSALYLITADSDLWRRVKDQVAEQEINLREFDRKDLSILGYVLLDVASDLLYGTKKLAIKDMSDTYLFFDKTFLLVMEAVRISRFGYKVLDFIESKQEDKT